MYHKSALEVRDLFVNGEISAEEIAEQTLKRISYFDKEISSFLSIFSERMITKARLLDQKRSEKKPLGKLAGIPIAIKDNIHVKGELTTCASRFLSNYRAPFDATVSRLLEEEDALLIGKTNLDEFAMGSSTENSAYQQTKNPWNLKSSPGGSSGGSAAAVAARFCRLALGSDTGGSIRQPAALCGVVGFKPTYGRVSRYGLVAFASSFDQIGSFSPTVAESALIMEVIGAHCRHDATSLDIPGESYVEVLKKGSIKGKRIATSPALLHDLSPLSAKSFTHSLALLKERGAEIVEYDLTLLKYSISVYYILATAEASTNLARFDGIRYGVRSPRAQTVEEIYEFSKQEGFGPEVKRRILLGTFVLSSGYQEAYYKRAQKVRTLIIQELRKAFEISDFIAMPVTPHPSFLLGSLQDPLQMYLQDIYTIPANLAGLPAISIPTGFNESREPLALQLMGPPVHDAALLQIAHLFEQEQRGSHIPPLFDKDPP
jgi:aspartyl-tRNA(Asn)/glutamyl-tRNA(Gln) amidotransferase subunit A